uniref:Uncharacterized protein n=1 Tax=Salix viminalis TaxID=40686 RepID=A0A6N2L4Q9_SALVM
MSRWKKSFG